MKTKEVKYNYAVPESIQNLMGTKPYKYIHNYNTCWEASVIREPEILNTTKTTRYDITDLQEHGSIETLIDALQGIRESEDYISSYIDCDYDYDGYSYSIMVEKKRHFTEKEQIAYDKAVVEFEEEKKIFALLQELIVIEQKEQKKREKAAMKESIRRQIEELEEKANKLRKKL